MSNAFNPGDLAKSILPDLADSGEIAAVQSSRLRLLTITVSALLLILILLAAVIPIGGAVIGGGQVGTETRVKRIAHPTGGVISSILVHNGEHVKEGQLLLRLDDRVSGADARYSSLTVDQLLAQRARLEAERLGANAILFPTELTTSDKPTARQAMGDEAQLFELRRREESEQRAQLQARISQHNSEIAGLNAQISAIRKQRALIEPERKGVRELWDKQLVTIDRLNQLERTAVDMEGNTAALSSQIAQVRARITEVQQQLIQLGQSRRVQAGTDLSQVNSALNQQQMRSVAANDQLVRSEIRAPYSGFVEKIAFAAIGDVVRPAEPIMEIVPDKDLMVVEAMISPVDIDQVKTGQSARVTFSSFNLAATPQIPGKVLYVATDRSDNPQAQQTFYMVRIAVDQEAVRREGLQLKSGMPAEVFIETGGRSMISYLTKPLRDQFMRAFRDD